MRKCKFKGYLAGLILLLTFPINSLALDGNRKGFVIGFGLGRSDLAYHLKQNTLPDYYDPVSYTRSGTANYERRVTNLNNFTTNFVLGYGLNNQWVLNWSSKVSWFGEDPLVSYIGEGSEVRNYISGIAGIELVYYFNPKSPSLFVSTALGYSNIGDFEEGKNHLGFGFSWGAGYEFAPVKVGDVEGFALIATGIKHSRIYAQYANNLPIIGSRQRYTLKKTIP